MKLIRWVEVHIGRSRKKAKKTPTKEQGSPRCGFSPETPVRASPLPTTPASRLRDAADREQVWQRRGSPSRAESRASSTAVATSAAAAATASLQPRTGNLSKLPVAHIRTSFLDQAPVSPADASSPRQRSRIKTNPWIPSPRSPCGSSSADSGWAGSRSSTGSEGSEPGDMALLLHEPPWRGGHWASLGSLPPPARLAGESLLCGASPLRPRTSSTLDRRPSPLIGSSASDGYLRAAAAATPRRPESARLQRRDACGARRALVGTRISDDDSSTSSEDDDEAYSEDFLQSEDSSDVVTVVKAASPQTDSACDPGSCTTTPLSECSSSGSAQLHSAAETLADKVRRLRAQRMVVQQKMHEARVEEQASREQRIRLHRELMQFRRLMLLHTLQGLRSDLEQRTAVHGSGQAASHEGQLHHQH
ncbi:uncharacterized protein LOC144152740 [Haemaphysalis longicornis]